MLTYQAAALIRARKSSFLLSVFPVAQPVDSSRDETIGPGALTEACHFPTKNYTTELTKWQAQAPKEAVAELRLLTQPSSEPLPANVP